MLACTVLARSCRTIDILSNRIESLSLCPDSFQKTLKVFDGSGEEAQHHSGRVLDRWCRFSSTNSALMLTKRLLLWPFGADRYA